MFPDDLDKIHQTLCCQIDCYEVSPNFSYAKLLSFMVDHNLLELPAIPKIGWNLSL